jgi:hypothetical protein
LTIRPASRPFVTIFFYLQEIAKTREYRVGRPVLHAVNFEPVVLIASLLPRRLLFFYLNAVGFGVGILPHSGHLPGHLDIVGALLFFSLPAGVL